MDTSGQRLREEPVGDFRVLPKVEPTQAEYTRLSLCIVWSLPMSDAPKDGHPKRIQRKRTKGWRMPSNAVYVGRPTKFGNPFRVCHDVAIPPSPAPMWAVVDERGRVLVRWDTKNLAALDAVDRFRRLMREPWAERPAEQELIAGLRGKDLACFCPLDQPCHADVLLELANGARR
jgi:hypothetical protein